MVTGKSHQVFLLTAMLAATVYCSVDLTFTSSPNKLELGLTPDLTITCNASINATTDSGMVYLTSLVISHNTTALASVSIYSPSGKAIPPFFGINNGHFNISGKSSISITINNISENDTGTYHCEAVGIDDYNQLEREIEDIDIIAHTPDNSTYLKEIQTIQAQMKELNAKISKIAPRWSYIDEDPLFTRIDRGGKTSYLLSQTDLGHVSLLQFVCFVQGGYLAEVNDVDEFEFLRSELLSRINGTNDVIVWLGTSDAAVEGQWRHQYHPGDQVFKSWAANSGYDCMAMTARTDFHNEDLDCQEPGRALCELKEFN